MKSLKKMTQCFFTILAKTYHFTITSPLRIDKQTRLESPPPTNALESKMVEIGLMVLYMNLISLQTDRRTDKQKEDGQE